MAKDNNFIDVELCSDSSGNPLPLKVDPITGELLIEILQSSSSAGGVTEIKRDENSINVAMAYDETNPRPFLTDTNNRLLIDLI